MNRREADAAATALLDSEPRFSGTWLGQMLRHLRLDLPGVRGGNAVGGIPKMPEPNGFESPGSPQWEIMHRHGEPD